MLNRILKIINIFAFAPVLLFLGHSTLAQAVPTLTFTADRSEIIYGQNVNLSWSSTGADSCLANIGWSGSKVTSGSLATGALSENTTFVLTCRGAGGEVIKSVSVIVTGGPEPAETPYDEDKNIESPPPRIFIPSPRVAKPQIVEIPPPSITFLVNPIIISGSSTEIVWSTRNAESCEAGNAWTGPKELFGTESTGVITTDTAYSLSCVGKGGESTKTINIIIKKEKTFVDSFIEQMSAILNFILEKIFGLF